MNEMVKKQGTMEISGTVSYVPQQSWIINATLRDNILFGSEYNEKRYKKVLEVCSLLRDFHMLLERLI